MLWFDVTSPITDDDGQSQADSTIKYDAKKAVLNLNSESRALAEFVVHELPGSVVAARR